MLYKDFGKNSSGGAVTRADKSAIENKIISNQKLCSSFKDNIWGTDLADMQSLSTYNKWFRFLLCVIGIYSKYARVVPLKDKKGIRIANLFQKKLNKSKSERRKPKKVWVDKGSRFYKRIMKSWLKIMITR